MKIQSLSEINLIIGSLINSLPTADWLNLNGQDAIDQVVCDGFVNKFEAEDDGQAERLHAECESAWQLYDESLPSEVVPESFQYINPFRVRTALRERLSEFAINFEDGWVGPGETFDSANGWVDPSTKLTAQWTVTPACYDLFEKWVLAHRRLRRLIADSPDPTAATTHKVAITVAGKRLEFQAPREGVDLGSAAARACTDRGEEPHFHKGLFWIKLREKVKVVHGNRFASVPKNNKKRRPICIEPFGNMICQKMIGAGIRRCLKSQGINLQTGQARHKEMIGTGKYATIDLSNASDSISLALARCLLPEFFVKLLEATRSPYTFIDGEWIPLRKLSSMGNGFTFELMTLILHTALCTELGTDDVSVYGDDIVVPLSMYNAALWVIRDLGFSPNPAKSCGDGRKAESCGAFVVDGAYVTRYDFKRVESMLDLVVAGNKILRLLWADQVSGQIKQVLEKIGLLIVEHIPERFHGPRAPTDDLPSWLEVGIHREKTALETHVSQSYCSDVWCVSVPRRKLRKYEPRNDHAAVIVGLRTGRRPWSYNKNRTIDDEVKVLIIDGLPLMARKKWSDYQRLSRVNDPCPGVLIPKGPSGQP